MSLKARAIAPAPPSVRLARRGTLFTTILIAFLAVLLAALQYRLWYGRGGIGDLAELHSARDAQSLENRRLRERNRVLEAEVADLKSGLQAIEERARTEMGMIREDEVFYQIIEVPAERP
ncbi:MAG: cell division protein FtsB [Gammaproteobacteria bacterium]